MKFKFEDKIEVENFRQTSDKVPVGIRALSTARQEKLLLLADSDNCCVKEFDLAKRTSRTVYQSEWVVCNVKEIHSNKEDEELMATLEREVEKETVYDDHDYSEPYTPATRVCISKKMNGMYKCEQAIQLPERTTVYFSSLEQLPNGNIIAGFMKLHEIPISQDGKFKNSCQIQISLPTDIRRLALNKKENIFIALLDNSICEFEFKSGKLQELNKYPTEGVPTAVLIDNKNDLLLYEMHQQHKIMAVSLKEGAVKNSFETSVVAFGPEGAGSIDVACWTFVGAERLAFVSRETWRLSFLRQIQD